MNPDFKGPAELDGLFSGYNEKRRKYDKTTWTFQMDEDGIAQEGPDPAGPQLRLPAAEEALCPLHPGEGLRHHRHPQGETPGGLQDSTPPPASRTRPAPSLLRHGLDPAHRRHPEHPGHVHHPAAARQHGDGRRRHQRPARRVQRPGFHRPRAPVPYPARLHPDADGRPGRPGRPTTRRTPRRRKTRRASTGGATGPSTWPAT